jgi:hypothetical protein
MSPEGSARANSTGRWEVQASLEPGDAPPPWKAEAFRYSIGDMA